MPNKLKFSDTEIVNKIENLINFSRTWEGYHLTPKKTVEKINDLLKMRKKKKC